MQSCSFPVIMMQLCTFPLNTSSLLAADAIQDHGQFFVALSGGSTPKAIYEVLCQPQYSSEIEWSKIHLFWSDERSVPPTDPDSNYRMAMKAGFEKMLLLPEHIHRMEAETDIEKHALQYEKKILKILNGKALISSCLVWEKMAIQLLFFLKQKASKPLKNRGAASSSLITSLKKTPGA